MFTVRTLILFLLLCVNPMIQILLNQQWTNIFPFFPQANPLGRPRTQNFREILNAILYILRAGCYLMIFLSGKLFTIIFEVGKKKVCGIISMII